LTLKKVDASHAAKYTVKTVGPSSSGSLYVEEIPVEFLVKLKDVKVKEKETAVFTCELNKENAPVKWFKSGTEIFSNDIKYKFVVDGSKYSLKIFDCELEDKNDYTISYRNKKSTANLEVEELAAEILKPLKDLTVYEKDEIVLECEFNRPNVEASWQKDNVDIKYSLGTERHNKKVNGNVYRLTIYEAKLEDAGSYSCTVKSTKTSCVVKVLDNIAKGLSNQSCTEGDEVKFECLFNKEVKSENVIWYKDGVKVDHGDDKGRFQIISDGKTQTLVIKNAKLDDIGNYEIKIGNLKSSATLKVKGKFLFYSNI
jgi:hypothetical protein